jgi:hypothetical protein
MDWTPFYVTFAVLVLALWVVPAGIELLDWRLRILGRRVRNAWTDYVVRPHRLHPGVHGRSYARAVSRLSARDRRLDDFNDAA